MSLHIDEKFLNSVAWTLRNFRKKAHYLWNFSCPICGDSKNNKRKARAYIYRNGDILSFKCHNCGCTLPFGELIRKIDENLYDEYIKERFFESRNKEREDTSEKKV